MAQDPFTQELERRLAARGRPAAAIEALAGDVSPRRYARITLAAGGTAVAAVYPPEMAATYHRFTVTDALLRDLGVRTPRILATDPGQTFMLLEDLGPETLFDLDLSWSQRRPHYHRAAAIAQRIGTLEPATVATLNPTLDREVLARELEQTWEVFLLPRGLLPDAGVRRALEEVFDHLCATLGALPPVPCHRDFMVRNLILLPESEAESVDLAVLDHQDLRLGPPPYDLASLLNDSLFPPPEVEAEILEAVGLTDEVPYRQAAVQRTFKAVGTFAAFAARGSDRRLPLIPPTLERGLDQLERLPEGEDLVPRLRRTILSPPF